MAGKVDQFLKESGGNNFTETAPRPPVPGEENEIQSNGGMSTRSSGSQKSHGSHTSGRSLGSNKGEINPATPRKSNLDKTVTSLSCSMQGSGDDLDMEAPLGFEPEGSAANSPPFTENSTPPYLKWAENLKYLLDDRDGVHLFLKFLDQEGIGAYSVNFWFACQGLKKKEQSDKSVQHVIRVIHKKYIKSDRLPCISINTKKVICEKLQQDIMDQEVFDAAQQEVEEDMKNNTYPLFLKSDMYVQYVSKGGESPKSSNSSSGSNSARPTSGLLPPLQEDEELQTSDLSSSFGMGGPPRAKLSAKSHFDPKKPEVYSGSYSTSFRPPPYHASYAPTSAQDSEIQSLSSTDALTDDTRSLTDSSLDGFSQRSHKERKMKKYQKAMQRRAAPNRENSIFIPRTERAPKERNIAETDRERFAAMLVEKLEQVKREREKEERIQMSLSKVMNASDVCEPPEKSIMSTSSVSAPRGNTSSLVGPLLTSSMIDEENADSILEEHCSRIWESSNQETPNRSPGRHSPPKPKSPDRTRKGLSQTASGTSSMPGTLHSKPLHNRRRPDFHSMLSFDSGVGEDKPAVETHKHIHHHHHHHHGQNRKSKHKLEIQAQHHSMVCWGGEGTPRPHTTGAARKTNIRNHSDASSNIDSGISLIDSIPPPQVPDIRDPSTTKVLQWMLDNDNVNCTTSSAHPADSDKSSSNKRPHKSTALLPGGPSQPHKQSASKKSSSHGNRSASADSGSRAQWTSSAAAVLPSQPFAQDSSMPLLPLPNTAVQMEEVKRRLEADQSRSGPVKSKSFAGVPSKEKRSGVPMSQSSSAHIRSGMSTTRTVPSDLDLSADATGSQATDKKKRSSGSGNTSTSSKPEETSIGYYLCGEPIPYKITVQQASVTLGHFKHLISKRGNYRYFFKTHSVNQDFDSDVVFEEMNDDSATLPTFEGKVVAKIERID